MTKRRDGYYYFFVFRFVVVFFFLRIIASLCRSIVLFLLSLLVCINFFRIAKRRPMRQIAFRRCRTPTFFRFTRAKVPIRLMDASNSSIQRRIRYVSDIANLNANSFRPSRGPAEILPFPFCNYISITYPTYPNFKTLLPADLLAKMSAARSPIQR